jgi:chemotaxis protein CheX
MEAAVEMLNEALGPLGESVWEQTFGLPLVPCEGDAPTGAMIQGQVHVTGRWQGTLVVQCSPAAARRAAAIMFDRPGDELSGEDVCDVVGEVANIFGGNVKGLMAESGCRLSMPLVVIGSGMAIHAPNARIVARQAFESEGEPVIVTVFEAIEPVE